MCYTNTQRKMKHTGKRKEIKHLRKQDSIIVWGTIGQMYTWHQMQIDQERSIMCQGEQFGSGGGQTNRSFLSNAEDS